MAHVADKLRALLAGAVPPEEQVRAEAHLASCASCREERDLLAAALPVIPPLAPVEPRPGFAASVAFNARDRRTPPFARWRRWVLGAAALGTAAVAAVVVVAPRLDRPGQETVVLAQRLELYEDLAVVQNFEALQDLEVVAVLHTLEARP